MVSHSVYLILRIHLLMCCCYQPGCTVELKNTYFPISPTCKYTKVRHINSFNTETCSLKNMKGSTLLKCGCPTLVGFWLHYPTVWGSWHVWTPGSPPPRIQAPASCKLMVHSALRHRRWSPWHQVRQRLGSCSKYIKYYLHILCGHACFMPENLCQSCDWYNKGWGGRYSE